MKQIAGSLKLELAQFRELAAFIQFGADLDKATVAQIERGKRLSALLIQDQGVHMPVEEQILVIFAGTKGFIDEFPVDSIGKYEEKMLEFVNKNFPDILREIRSKKVIDTELEQSIVDMLKKFSEEFRAFLKDNG